MNYTFEEKTDKDNIKVMEIIRKWGSDILVSCGKIYSAENLNGIIAYLDEKMIGLCLYYLSHNECEIVLLEALEKNKGIGKMLIERIKEVAKNTNCNRLWLTTSNDNIDAIRFYQRRGFHIANVFVKGMEKARKIKPEIPLVGNYEIPIRDEFVFEMQL